MRIGEHKVFGFFVDSESKKLFQSARISCRATGGVDGDAVSVCCEDRYVSAFLSSLVDGANDGLSYLRHRKRLGDCCVEIVRCAVTLVGTAPGTARLCAFVATVNALDDGVRLHYRLVAGRHWEVSDESGVVAKIPLEEWSGPAKVDRV